ncbi:hypothetical protein [Geodermatophilus obscurus]|uniref:hypothetical protein n=1 Tax=Geodermatophilus obscurus TaxID=1861 RepID=UPI0011409A33|nr:hypothetical protein [Geodermatophilus obscurus]
MSLGPAPQSHGVVLLDQPAGDRGLAAPRRGHDGVQVQGLPGCHGARRVEVDPAEHGFRRPADGGAGTVPVPFPAGEGERADQLGLAAVDEEVPPGRQ